MPHLFTSRGHGTFSPDGKVNVSPDAVAQINSDTNSAELRAWATAPDYFSPAYYTLGDEPDRVYRRAFYPSLTGAKVATWGGTTIGHIVSARVHMNNLGARVVSMRVRGTNGAEYYGRASFDHGTLIRLRKAKS